MFIERLGKIICLDVKSIFAAANPNPITTLSLIDAVRPVDTQTQIEGTATLEEMRTRETLFLQNAKKQEEDERRHQDITIKEVNNTIRQLEYSEKERTERTVFDYERLYLQRHGLTELLEMGLLRGGEVYYDPHTPYGMSQIRSSLQETRQDIEMFISKTPVIVEFWGPTERLEELHNVTMEELPVTYSLKINDLGEKINDPKYSMKPIKEIDEQLDESEKIRSIDGVLEFIPGQGESFLQLQERARQAICQMNNFLLANNIPKDAVIIINTSSTIGKMILAEGLKLGGEMAMNISNEWVTGRVLAATFPLGHAVVENKPDHRKETDGRYASPMEKLFLNIQRMVVHCGMRHIHSIGGESYYQYQSGSQEYFLTRLQRHLIHNAELLRIKNKHGNSEEPDATLSYFLNGSVLISLLTEDQQLIESLVSQLPESEKNKNWFVHPFEDEQKKMQYSLQYINFPEFVPNPFKAYMDRFVQTAEKDLVASEELRHREEEEGKNPYLRPENASFAEINLFFRNKLLLYFHEQESENREELHSVLNDFVGITSLMREKQIQESGIDRLEKHGWQDIRPNFLTDSDKQKTLKKSREVLETIIERYVVSLQMVESKALHDNVYADINTDIYYLYDEYKIALLQSIDSIRMTIPSETLAVDFFRGVLQEYLHPELVSDATYAIIRHDKTPSTEAKKLTSVNEPLSVRAMMDTIPMAIAYKQACDARGITFSRVVSSPMLRALQMARIYAHVFGISEKEIIIRDDLRERDYDESLAGLPYTTLQEMFPDQIYITETSEINIKNINGMEETEPFIGRMKHEGRKIREDYPGENCMVFTHGSAGRALILGLYPHPILSEAFEDVIQFPGKFPPGGIIELRPFETEDTIDYRNGMFKNLSVSEIEQNTYVKDTLRDMRTHILNSSNSEKFTDDIQQNRYYFLQFSRFTMSATEHEPSTIDLINRNKFSLSKKSDFGDLMWELRRGWGRSLSLYINPRYRSEFPELAVNYPPPLPNKIQGNSFPENNILHFWYSAAKLEVITMDVDSIPLPLTLLIERIIKESLNELHIN